MNRVLPGSDMKQDRNGGRHRLETQICHDHDTEPIERPMITPKPLLELELRPVEAPAQASGGACVYVLLPTLEELLGHPGFGAIEPICLPGARRPIDGWTLFGTARERGWTLH
jgi:hypothetical protein